MIIGIDASRALKPQRTGTEVHNAEIIKHLIALDTQNTYRLYSSVPQFGDMLKATQNKPNVQWRVMPFARGWTLFRLSWEMLVNPPDVLFIPAHILPLIRPKKSVVMLHDIGFDHFPELYKWTDKLYHRYAVRVAKRWASHILTPSEFTKRDLHQKYGIPLSQMTRVYHGFDAAEFHPAPESEPSPEKQPYFYYVGRLEYKKNIVRLLQAFDTFKTKTGLPHKFVLVGRPAHGYDIIAQTHALMHHKDDVVFLGYTAQPKATQYLRHAVALVFPTLFEGFGIPVLEAYASGVPTITSNTTSLPEAAGEGALLVDPTSVEQIAAAMERLATDEKLRHKLLAEGAKHYKKFSWDKAAQETLRVLEKAVKN